jgi:hypothetical protein
MRGQPSVAEVVRSHQLISPEKIVKIFKRESETKDSFVSAARNLGFWTAEVENHVSRELKQRRVPLGHILVRRGALTIEKMTAALDDFLGELPLESPPPKSVEKAAVEAQANVDSPLVAAFRSEFAEERLNKIMSFCESLSRQSVEAQQIDTFVSDINQLGLTAQLAEAGQLEKMMTLLQEVLITLEHVLKNKREIKADLMSQLSSSSVQSLRTVVDLARHIGSGGSESQYFANNDQAGVFEGAWVGLQKVRDTLKAMGT